MKKTIILLCVLLLCFSLCGCQKEENNISEQHYQYGAKAIEIADQYIDYKLTAAEAYEQLEDLYHRVEELPETEFEDEAYLNNSQVETYTLLLDTAMMNAKYKTSSNTLDDIYSYRNTIAKAIGEETREK